MGAVSRRQHLSAQLHRAGYDPGDRHRRRLDGFCIIQFELDGACTQTVGRAVLARWTTPSTRPLKAGLPPAVRRQRLRRQRAGHLLRLGRLRERGRRRSGCRSSRRTRFAEVRGTVPDYQLRPNALERVNLRANLGANVSARCRPAGQRRLHLQRHPVRRERQQLPHHHRQRRGQRQSRKTQPRLVLHPRRALRRAGHPVGRAVHRRPHRQLAAAELAHHPGHAGIRRHQPAGRAVLPHRPGRGLPGPDRGGMKYDNRFQISQTSVDLAATRPIQADTEPRAPRRRSAASSSATSRPARSRPDAGCRPAPRPSPAPAAPRPGTPPSSPAPSGLTWRRRSRSRSGSSSPAPSASTTTAPSARTSTPRSTPRPASPGCCRRSRSSTRASSTPCGCAAPSASAGSSPAPPTRSATSLRWRASAGGAATTGITFGSLGNPDLKPERSGEIELGLDAALFKDRVSVEFTYYNKQTKDALVAAQRGPVRRRVRVQFFNLGEVKNHGFEVAINTRVIDSRSVAWDLAAERLGLRQQAGRAG